MTSLTRAVPFNDADALARLLEELEGQVAGLIMEPAMMNVNIVPPVPGYLERVRELCSGHGVVLIFDEVKTGAAEAALCEVLTDEAYAQLHAANRTLMEGCEQVITRYGLPAHTVGMGSKGCVVFSTEPIREYRDYLTKIHHDLSDLAWLYHMNNGIFMTPGRDEEWTLSVLHTDEDLARYVEVFEAFARDVTSAS